MTQEEKAKAYDKAIERAKSLIGDTIIEESGQHIAEVIFPELKESEDERIIKILQEGVNDVLQDQFCTNRGVSKEKVLSWLEKQGEQKPTIEMKSAEESLGIDSNIYNEIVDECIYGEQKSQRMISAEAKEAMYAKPADKVEPKCEESKTKIFDAPTPFEDKLYAFVAACEFLAIPSKIEFILEHSQEILDAAREQIGKEQSSTWSKEDEKEYKYVLKFVDNILNNCGNKKDYEHCKRCYDWLKSLKTRYTWKPSDEQMADLWNMLCECRPADHQLLQDIYYGLKKLRENNL